MNSISTNDSHVHDCVRRKSFRLPHLADLLRIAARCTYPALATAAIVLLIPVLAAAQGAAAQPRITQQISESNLTTLRGNTHPLARAQYDQGAVADSQPMRRMVLLLQRSSAQDAALKQLVDEQQSKASPNYHQWLTPQQIGQQYGPADADIQTVTNWLQSQGFQVARVSAAKTLIEFSGTAGQVRSAFHTQIHRYSVNGEQHFANSGDPQIPTALVPVVAGPVSLNNFPKKALSRKLGTFRKTKATGQVAPLYSFGGCTTITGAGSNCNAVGPGDFANIYNVAKLWSPGISGTPIDGTNQTIAIVGDSEICTATSPDFGIGYSYIGPNGTSVTCSSDDVAQFRTLFGLPAKSPNVILDGPDPGFNGDEIEGDLDVEWSGAVAKGATIDFVIAESTETTAGTDLAAEYIVDNNLAPVLSESFGACEAELGTDGSEFEAVLWEQAAAQGITVVVSAGDSGSAACDDPDTQNAANQFGAAVNGIASTAFNVAAGGTDFDITASNYETAYWGGGGSASNKTVGDVSALSYIPETTWNDSCAQNFTGALTGCTPTEGGIVAGGGGQSNCAAQDNAGNCYYYAKPSWQTVASGSGLSAANDVTRDLPDISLFAADGYVSNSFYIICEADITGGPCNLTTPYFDFVGVGGTSSAAPTFAGMMALVNQNMTVNNPSVSGRQGNANYVLYNLASKQTASSCNSSTGPASTCTFNDITKGNNSVPCNGASFGCSNATSGGFGVEEAFNLTTGALTGNIAWNTATGLDLASGLGSVNAFNLVSNWPAAGLFTPTATTLCLSALVETALASCATPISITHGQTVYVNMTVTANGSAIPVTETFPSNSGSTFVDYLFPTLAEDVALVGTAGNTGAVDHFTSNDYSLSNADIYPLSNGTTVGQNYSTQYLVGGSYSVIAHYSGDGTYGSSFSTTPIPVTVTPEASTATVTVQPFNPAGDEVSSPIPYGDYTQVRVDVIGNTSGQESATGLVTLTDNGQPIVNPTGSTTLNFTLNTEGYLEDQTGFLAVGSHSFQATYKGDASYNPSAISTAVALTVTQAATTTTVTPSASSIATTANITLTAFVDTLSIGKNPSGTVTFFNNGVQIGSPVPNTQFVATLDSNGFDAVQAALTTKLTTAGTASITATYSGDTNYTTSSATAVSVTVTGPPTLAVTTTSVSSGSLNLAYTSTLVATGGVTPYTWTLNSGNLPTGLTLSAAGVISGTPTASGTSTFTVKVTDSQTNTAISGSLSIAINASLSITTTSLPSGFPSVVAGVAYPSTTLAATGGVAPYTWTTTAGSLPAGLALSTAGVITGTPTAASIGAASFTVQVKDSQNNTATASLSIAVSGFTFAAVTPIAISAPGATQTELVSLTEAGGFTGTVTLRCAVTGPTGAVDLPTCSFGPPDLNFTSPNVITFIAGQTTGNATMTVFSTAASGALYHPPSRPLGRDWPLAAAAFSLLSFLFLLAVPRQRRWGLVPLAVLLVVVTVAGVSCSGGGSSSGAGSGGGVTNPGTTTGSYTITVTATPTTGAAESTAITVTVQ